MDLKIINTGVAPNTKTGDPIRTAFDKTNRNFDEVRKQIKNIIIPLAGEIYKGDADTETNPGVPDHPVFYSATEKGIYTFFDNINVTTEDGFVFLSYNGSEWVKQVIDFPGGLILNWDKNENISYPFVRSYNGGIYRAIKSSLSNSMNPRDSASWENMIYNSYLHYVESELLWSIDRRIDESGESVPATTTMITDGILIPINADSVTIPVMYTKASPASISFYGKDGVFISSFYQVEGIDGARMVTLPIPSGSQFLKGTYWKEGSTNRNELDFDVRFNFNLEKTIQDNTFSFENLIPTGSNLSNGYQVNSDGAGLFRKRFGHEEIEIKDGYVHLDIDSSLDSNSGFWILNKFPHSVIDKEAIFSIQGYIKYEPGSDPLKVTFYYSRSPHIDLGDTNKEGWQYFRANFFDFPAAAPYNDNRLFLFATGHSTCSIKGLSLTPLQETEIKNYWETISLQSVNINRLPRLNKAMIINEVVNIGFFGDSWTQGVDAPNLKTYAKYTARLLWEKYGYAGLGWFDFGHSNNTDMLCVDDEAVKFNSSNVKSIVNRDHNSLGITICHRVMSLNTSYTIEFIDPDRKVDDINILSYKNSEFRYRINSGSWKNISNGDSQNIYSEKVSNSDITKIEFESLKENSIIFGMDLSYGDHGVKVHKIGNRGLTTDEVLSVDRDVYKEEMNQLNLDFISVCLLTNDRTNEVDPRKVRTNIYEITKIFSELEGNVSRLILCPTDTKRIRDIQVDEYNYYLKRLAIENQIALLDLSPVLGTRQDIEGLTLIDDEVHPNHVGCQMIADYIVKHVFNYKKISI